MEPAIVGVGAYGAARIFNVISRTGRDVKDGIDFGKRKLRLYGTYQISWLGLDFTPTESDPGFDADQLEDLDRFLSDTRTQPIMALFSLAMLGGTPPDKELLAQVKSAFANEARIWNHDKHKPWTKNVEHVWNRLVTIYTDSLPSIDSDDFDDEIEYFQEFIDSTLRHSGSSHSRTRFFKTLIEIASDIARLRAACDRSCEMAGHICATHLDPIITHTEVDRAADFNSLYVDRSFVDRDDTYAVDSSILTSGTSPFRIVVTGAPGAGKTTFIQHFRAEMAKSKCDRPARPVLAVRCREYAAASWDKTSLVEFTASRYNAEYSDTLTEETFRDILSLGRAIVVFDGLDEITDPLRRVEFTKRVSAFSAQFPILSILITSREVGYERTPVDKAIFTHVRLKEFSINQTQKYVTNWFRLVNREELTERFMHDSESIPDIRLNPLMLSLLCLLYREMGAIPSRRLDIYSECARLLFHRWDKHRQIDAQGSIPDFSDSLMQEIARWFYTSTTAQAGLTETVIRLMLKKILVDQCGFPDGKADRSASDFLDFCAGRAWLLGTIGTDHRGERIFSFTHKTFYEYFAAESFSRHASSPEDIAGRITTVFTNDSSSVLPELLIQSYGKHVAQGSIRVLKALSRNAPVLLLLRMLEGASLPASSRKLVFDRLIEVWIGEGIAVAEFISLLQLNQLARDQFASDYLNNPSLRSKFIANWAAIALCGHADRYLDTWGHIVDDIASDLPVAEIAEQDRAVANWLILRGIDVPVSSKSSNTEWPALVCASKLGWVPGLVWVAVDRRLRSGKPIENENLVLGHVRKIVLQIDRGTKIPEAIISRLLEALGSTNMDKPWTSRSEIDAELRPYTDLLAYVAFAFSEKTFTSVLIDRISPIWAGKLIAVREVRESYVNGPGYEVIAETVDTATEALEHLPVRASRWMTGETSIMDLANDPLDESDEDEAI